MQRRLPMTKPLPYVTTATIRAKPISCANLKFCTKQMLAMIALKHHLDDSAEMTSKGRWVIEWGAGYNWSSDLEPHRIPKGAVEIYEHVFPDRAPVRNILSEEGEGW